jgi:hypothetical protein
MSLLPPPLRQPTTYQIPFSNATYRIRFVDKLSESHQLSDTKYYLTLDKPIDGEILTVAPRRNGDAAKTQQWVLRDQGVDQGGRYDDLQAVTLQYSGNQDDVRDLGFFGPGKLKDGRDVLVEYTHRAWTLKLEDISAFSEDYITIRYTKGGKDLYLSADRKPASAKPNEHDVILSYRSESDAKPRWIIESAY